MENYEFIRWAVAANQFQVEFVGSFYHNSRWIIPRWRELTYGPAVVDSGIRVFDVWMTDLEFEIAKKNSYYDNCGVRDYYQLRTKPAFLPGYRAKFSKRTNWVNL